MTNGRRKSWNVVVRHHAKVPTTSYIEWQPNSGIKCIFQQLSWTSTYSTKYQNFVQKPICDPPLTRFPLTRYPLISQAEPSWAEPSWGISIFELKPSWQYVLIFTLIRSKFFKFPNFASVSWFQSTLWSFFLNLCRTKSA